MSSPLAHASGAAPGTSPQDLQPLAWVRDDIHRGLEAALLALREALAPGAGPGPARASALDAAARQLHASAGALEMVGLRPGALVVGAAEAVVLSLSGPAASSEGTPPPDTLALVARACFAVSDYLDALLRNLAAPGLQAACAVALFPQYAALRAQVGDTRVHPAVLWAASGAAPAAPLDPSRLPWARGATPAGGPGAPTLMPETVLRPQLDAQVLRLIKAGDTEAAQAAQALSRLAADRALALQDPADQALWGVAAGFFQGLAQRPGCIDAVAKRSASRLLVLYAQQAAGQPVDRASLELELLYGCAAIGPVEASGSPWLDAVRQAYGLAQAPALDHARAPFGRFDPALLAAARKRLAAAREAWSALAAGDVRQLRTTSDQFAQVAQVITRLHPPLQPLSEALQAVAEGTTAGADIPSAPLALEVATVILFLEAVCQSLDPLDTTLGPRAARLAERLARVRRGAAPEPLEPWIESLYRQASDRQVMGSVVDELRVSLAEVERALDGFFRQREDRTPLQPVPGRLSQMRGVLSVLGLDQAGRAVLRMRDQVQSLWAEPEGPQAAVLVERLGHNLGALGFLVDMLHHQPVLARELFVFDEAQGELRPVMGRRVGQDPSALDPDRTPDLPLAPGLPAPPDPTGEDDLQAVFLQEAREVLTEGTTAVDRLTGHPDDLSTLTTLRRCFHTLKGSARMVGHADFGDAAWALEQVLNAWLAQARPADEALLAVARAALEGLRAWIPALAEGHTPGPQVAAFVPAAQALLTVPAPAAPADTPAPAADEYRQIGPLRIATGLFNVFLQEADDDSLRLQQGLSAWARAPVLPPPPELELLAHSLAGSAATVGLAGLSELARSLEAALHGPLRADDAPCLEAAGEHLRQLLHQFAAGLLREPDPILLAQLQNCAVETPIVAADPAVDSLPEAPTASPIDPALWALFEEEALELFAQLDTAWRDWLEAPGGDVHARDQVLRTLHTLKGGARLAGVWSLGDALHAAESQVEALAPHAEASSTHDLATDRVSAQLDALQAQFSALRRREGGSVEPPQPPAVAAGTHPSPPPAPAPATPPAPRPPGPQAPRSPPPAVTLGRSAAPAAMRVKAQLLDGLMNQAGEVMIAGARIESELRTLREGLQELSASVDRLRSQLRAVQIESESQLQSQRVQGTGAAAAGFDPLEFDRYTRLQELTRIMAESVNDIATVQRQLVRAVDATEDDLSAQARQTRELQRDLLRTRMVAFDAIADRLHRAVRQAGRDSGKSVQLVIEGAALEIDRGMLDRIAPALEHLLRNAVAHGIELPEIRAHRGKPETGQLRLAVEQAGNDVALHLTDDGGGLDLERIARRARALGLLADDEAVRPEDAAEWIFRPGFSTADQVTELAGRGVGLDAVRAEAQALGGRIEVDSLPGQGSRFRLVLPLTTAVTHVVMLRCGPLHFAVPASLVEGVVRGQAQALAAAQAQGLWTAGGPDDPPIPFFWGGALLRTSPRSEALDERTAAVVLLQSASQRLALQVDEVLGHREVVVKHLGPQLSRLPGLTGMTVLAAGDVVLIYNPVALAAVYGERARRFTTNPADAGLGPAPAEGAAAVVNAEAAADPALAHAAPASAVPLVLVVDDSLTVRRVTQRLLQREGVRVALAADGLQALERLSQETPALVLSDIEMPRMDGFELVRHVRGDPRWAQLPVVMITSRVAAKHRDHAQTLGVDHYLGKPYVEDELLALVRRYTGSAGPQGLSALTS